MTRSRVRDRYHRKSSSYEYDRKDHRNGRHKKKCHYDRDSHNSDEDAKFAKVNAKKVKSQKVKTRKLEARKICATDVCVDGVNIKDLLERPAQSNDYSFDALAPDGVFGDRTPIKPPTVNEEVFNGMLLSLRDNVIPELCVRFREGRKRLGLPKVPLDPDIVGTISLPIIFKAFPNPKTSEQEKLIQYNTSLGWNIEIANSSFPIGSTIPDQATSKFVGSVLGNILTIKPGDVSFGFVQQGTLLSGAGIPPDVYIVDQLSNDPLDGPFFKSGTYLLGKMTEDICNPEDVNLNLSDVNITGTLAQGPRIASIYIHYGYIEKKTGNVKVVAYDLGNRQFKPTIDFNPQDDPFNVQSWGEKYAGYRSITSNIAAMVWENMPDAEDTGCLQLVILRETGIIAFFPASTDCCDDKSRAISTVVVNPNCVTNCTANGNTSAATTTVTVDQGL